MSKSLKDYVADFVAKKIKPDDFANQYIEKWKIERDQKILGHDDEILSELLSSVFCLADMYNPDEDREEYELSGDQLLDAVNKLMADYIIKSK